MAPLAPSKIGLSTPWPDDFDAFWQGKLAAQATVLIIPMLTPVQLDVPGVELNIFTPDALGSKAHGYIAKSATKESFPR